MHGEVLSHIALPLLCHCHQRCVSYRSAYSLPPGKLFILHTSALFSGTYLQTHVTLRRTVKTINPIAHAQRLSGALVMQVRTAWLPRPRLYCAPWAKRPDSASTVCLCVCVCVCVCVPHLHSCAHCCLHHR